MRLSHRLLYGLSLLTASLMLVGATLTLAARRVTHAFASIDFFSPERDSLELHNIVRSASSASNASPLSAFLQRAAQRPTFSFASGFRIDPGRCLA